MSVLSFMGLSDGYILVEDNEEPLKVFKQGSKVTRFAKKTGVLGEDLKRVKMEAGKPGRHLQ